MLFSSSLRVLAGVALDNSNGYSNEPMCYRFASFFLLSAGAVRTGFVAPTPAPRKKRGIVVDSELADAAPASIHIDSVNIDGGGGGGGSGCGGAVLAAPPLQALAASPSAPEQLASLLGKRSGLATNLQAEIDALQVIIQ